MSALLDYDTGPLNWVRGEIDAALHSALGRVQAYGADADLSNALQLARDDTHQVAGVLRMVGLEGAATLATTLESCLQEVIDNRLQASEAVLRAMRNTLDGLQRWIKELADGRGSGELALFPLYKGLRELQGAERVFEGELFFPDLRVRAPGKPAEMGLSQDALAAEVKVARGLFQRGLLAFLRNVEAEQGLRYMRDALAAVERIAPSQASQTFWWACVGFVDSLIARGVEADFHVKQLLARVDLQMRRLIEGSPQVAERLLRDALFFVAKSQTLDGRAAEVRATLGLDRYLPGRGLLDPEALARMRPVLDAMQNGLKAAREHWHGHVESGQGDHFIQFQQQLEQMQPQAQLFEHSGLQALLSDMAAAAMVASQREGDARDQMNLEVAASLLFLQKAVDQEDILHADFPPRAEAQQARLCALIEGRALPASVLDSAGQREAEHDMLVHLAQEVGQNLKQMEEALDSFFRDESERESLAALPALAQQAQGALTMLELTDAASLLAAATALVQPFVSAGYPDDKTQQRLADAFSSLGIYIESFCAGRTDAVRILQPVLIDFGVIDADSVASDGLGDTVESGLPARKVAVHADYLEWRDHPDAESKKKYLDALTELSRDAELIDDATLKQQTRDALQACRDALDAPLPLDAEIVAMTGHPLPERVAAAVMTEAPRNETPTAPDRAYSPVPLEMTDAMPACLLEAPGSAAVIAIAQEIAQPDLIEIAVPVDDQAAATAECAAAIPACAPVVPTLLAAVPEDSEPELLEIFLEEAKEVLATLEDASNTCQSNPEDAESMTVIRRGFHTLKGSGRMVGLTDLGETAWRFEQLLNGWLSEKKPVSQDLLHLIDRGRNVFQVWVDALQTREPVALPVPALLAAVDRVIAGQPLDSEPIVAVAHPSEVEVAGETTMVVVAEVESFASDPVAVEVAVVAAGGDYCCVIEYATGAMCIIAHDGVVSDEVIEETVAECCEIPMSEVMPEATRVAAMTSAIEAEAAADAMILVECAPEVATPILNVGALIEYAVAAAVVEPVPPEEICIGSISLSAGLYEVFMIEAQQRLAVLHNETMRLAETDRHVVSEHARRAAHTLGGIAGTAGISPLSDLAHALELYWNRFSHTATPVSHLALVQDTVVRLQAMVDAIGQQQLPDAAADLIAVLGELEDERIAAVEASPEVAPAGFDVAAMVDAPTGDTPSDTTPATSANENVPALLDVSALVPEIKLHAPAPVFERREVADEIDQQLLPIFLEEAEVLLPAASAQLRSWKTESGTTVGRDALQRILHTIKGSARMVGAMRLGELTHVMESRVLAVIEGHLGESTEVFETLEAQLDRLAVAVEYLQSGEMMPQDDAPLVAPLEPVLAADEATVGPQVSTLNARTPAQAATRESNALTLRVRADWIDRLVNQAGEVAIARSRIESEVFAFKRHVGELTEALHRLRGHIREVEIQAESQMQATFHTQGVAEQFDPLEFDRFTRFQEVTRFLAESVNDISTVQHILLARLGEADAALIQQTRLNRELQQDLLRVRMVPLYSVAERLYRTVRQTARDVDKRAQLDIQGGELEIDRSVLEKVTAPLEHLLRNALAHGIETPEIRRAAGKAEFGEIVLSARQSGNEMMLTVKDDGGGLDYARIRAKAEANGMLLPGVEPTESLLAQMIFAAGFSTADAVSQVAGRGVGMDVVKSEISALGGRIDIVSGAGTGTTFNIYLPLTLAMTQAVMVQAAKRDYALPAPLVRQVLELKADELQVALAAGEVTWRGARYPLSYLPHLLAEPEAVHETQRYNTVLLLATGSSQAAVLVDAVEGTREIVVKNIGPQMARITGVVGATVRGDGRVVLILNPVPLALRLASQPRVSALPVAPVVANVVAQPPLVLVVDDSLTVRKITTRLLGREGYRFDSAKDGVDALEKMQDMVPDVVLLDVEMPRMDGFELARVMRNDARLKNVPIIMITSRTADKHRNHALEIGVNVYLGKPYQEQLLLEHIAEQVGLAVSV